MVFCSHFLCSHSPRGLLLNVPFISVAFFPLVFSLSLLAVVHSDPRWLNHGRQQILDAPAQAIPANVPSVLQAIKLLRYNPDAKIQLDMNIIGPAIPLMRTFVYLST